MLDKKLLQDWRQYQEHKKRVAMAENNVEFPCAFRNFEHLLTFIQKDGKIILCPPGRNSLSQSVIYRDLISGYTPADAPGLSLQITFVEEADQDPIVLNFYDRRSLLAATDILDNFTSERGNIPTPPTSSDSE